MSNPLPPDEFHQAFGPPSIPAPPMHFGDAWLERVMTVRFNTIGAGWFLGRTFYLLGEGLERLAPCVQAWSFLLPPSSIAWTVIGFNAYGAILLLDDDGTKGTLSPVAMIDPLTVQFVRHPDLDIFSLLGIWLPERKLPRFLDTSVYEEFLRSSGRLLGDDEILGIRQALPLGGEMKLENFTPINIIDYYRATGPVYAKAHAQLGKAD